MKRIIYENSDGTITVVIPVQNTNSISENFTEEQVLQRAIDNLPVEITNYVVLDTSAIPIDRSNRNAWVLSPDKQSVVVDPNKIATPAPAPTKEQLLAELQALTAKIQSLE